jgi:hypothetical protein
MVADLDRHTGGEPTMGFRTGRHYRRPIIGFAMLLGLALMTAASPAAAQGTPEQRAACENDAMRLCGQFVPDVDRITACMHARRSQLSPRCRAVFGRKRGR